MNTTIRQRLTPSLFVCCAFALLLGLLGACGDDGEPSGEASANDTANNAANNAVNNVTNNAVNNAANNDSGEPVVEAVTLETSDGKRLAARWTHAAEAQGAPAVLLIHQANQDKDQWGVFPEQLLEAGYAVLAMDLRGHGESDSLNGSLSAAFRDPEQFPRDAQAALDFLRASPVVDETRIGVVGTSVGANLAVMLMGQDDGVRAAVAASPRLSAALALAGGVDALTMRDFFCLAGANDGGGDQAASCQQLVAEATGETQLTILSGSSAHGVDIIPGVEEQRDAVLAWLSETL